MRLGYILLAHENFETLRPLLSTLCQNDDLVVLHYDASQPHISDIAKIKQHFPSVRFAKNVDVEWGEASIVQATLNAMQVFVDDRSYKKPDYITLLSGSCFPIKPREELAKFLIEHQGQEFIECHDISTGQWVKDGLEWARWEYFHFLNWRKNPKLFSLSEKIQRRLRIKRKFPYGSKMFMGSQWWTLSYSTITKLVEITDQHKLMDFIKRTWIPDEFYFQTLVANLVDNHKLDKPLMHHRFNSTGIPKIYTSSDIPELEASKKFFCRKVQQSDSQLIEVLGKCYQSGERLKDTAPTLDMKWQWYKEHGFKNWIQDCPLPITIIIDTDTDTDTDTDNTLMKRLSAQLTQDNTPFNVYGELFSQKLIDYNTEQPLVTYSPKDVKYRDYDWQEFIGQIALNSPSGFAFKVSSRYLNGLLDSLTSCPNVLFVDVAESFDDLKGIRQSRSLEYYLRGERCQYFRFDSADVSQLSNRIKQLISDNLYLSTLTKMRIESGTKSIGDHSDEEPTFVTQKSHTERTVANFS